MRIAQAAMPLFGAVELGRTSAPVEAVEGDPYLDIRASGRVRQDPNRPLGSERCEIRRSDVVPPLPKGEGGRGGGLRDDEGRSRREEWSIRKADEQVKGGEDYSTTRGRSRREEWSIRKADEQVKGGEDYSTTRGRSRREEWSIRKADEQVKGGEDYSTTRGRSRREEW